MFGAERGATRRHGGGHSGQVHGHHVGVALDDDNLTAPDDLPFGQVQPEEHLRFAIKRRFGSVEVLGLDAVVVEQPPRTETHHVTAQIPDRPQQPAVEPIDRSPLAVPGHSRLNQLVDGKSAVQQVFGELIPARRSETAAEPIRGFLAESALHQKLAGWPRLGRTELFGIKLLRQPVHLDQPGPGAAVTLHQGV